MPIVGDAKPALAAINAELKKRDAKPQTKEWLEKVNRWRATYPFYHPGVPNKGGQITPEGALDLLNDMLDPKNTIIVTDVGQHQMWAAQHLDCDLPRTFLSSGGAGTMGFGLPAAIGAKVAHPEKQVVLITGDGSFQMCSQERATAAVEKTNVKVVIMNNLALGMVHQWQNLFYDDRFSQTILADNPDFVKLADAYSWGGDRVSKPAEVEKAFVRLLESDKPALLDLRIPTKDNVFPMVAPGAGLDDVIGAVAVGDISEFVDESEGGMR